MSNCLQPTTRGRVAFLISLGFLFFLFSVTSWAPALYPPISNDPLVAKEQLLSRAFHLAIFQTISSIPPALLVLWLHQNALRTNTWPSLGDYVPFRVKVRQLKNSKLPWLFLLVFESILAVGIALIWIYYFMQHQFLSVIQSA